MRANTALPEMPEWKLPRAPLFRFCTLNLRNSSYPDEGAGIWEIQGYDNLDTSDELYVLRRVMPAHRNGSTGEFIKVWRYQHDNGRLRIWAANPEDPEFNLTDHNPGATSI